MHKTGLVLAILGLLVGCVIIPTHEGQAQDFPYAVPRAPEFDGGGNALPSGQADTEAPPRRKRSRNWQEQPPPPSPSDYRTVRPYVPPQDTPPAAQQPPGPRAPLGAAYQGPTSAPPPPPSAAAPRPSGSVQNRPDCSQYPMMIARSRAEPEMREVAKQYLSCLLMNGWNMEQARNQVIATIESTYRLAR